MLRLFSLATGGGYTTYLKYDTAEKVYWEGKERQRLGLQGEVDLGHFEMLRRGLDPNGGVLRPRAERPRGIAIYDLVVAAPKTVSVVAELYDRRLELAHREAAGYMRLAAEEQAMVRVGQNKVGYTGNLIQAGFHHHNSRSLDPQEHTHYATINMTWDEGTQSWRALDAHQIYKQQYKLGEVYRYVLAHKVEELGYSTRERESGYGFEIQGVPQTVIEKFSQRSHDRDLAMEGFREWHGREPTSAEVSILVRAHRPEKELGLEREEIREMQLQRLDPAEKYALEHVYEVSFQNAYSDENSRTDEPVKAIGSGDFFDRKDDEGKIDQKLYNDAMKFAILDQYESEIGNNMKPFQYAQRLRV